MAHCSGSPYARLTVTKNATGTDVASLDSLKSYYADRGCPLTKRQVQWIFVKNNAIAHQTPFQIASSSIAIGTGSTAEKLLLPNGNADILTFLGTVGVTTTTGDVIRVFVRIKNCHGEKDHNGFFEIIVDTACPGSAGLFANGNCIRFTNGNFAEFV